MHVFATSTAPSKTVLAATSAAYAHCSGSPEAAAATSHAAAVTASAVSSISAHRCLTAWKLPIGLPNCSRTLAYSTAVSRHQRVTPDASAAPYVTAVRRTASPVSPDTSTTPSPPRSSCALPNLRDWSSDLGRSHGGGAGRDEEPAVLGVAHQQMSSRGRVPDHVEARVEGQAHDRPVGQVCGGLAEDRRRNDRPQQRTGKQLVGTRLERDRLVQRGAPTAPCSLGQRDRGDAHLARRLPRLVRSALRRLRRHCGPARRCPTRPPTCAGWPRAPRARRRSRWTCSLFSLTGKLERVPILLDWARE